MTSECTSPPRLPVELWRLILRLSTLPPSLVDLPALSPSRMRRKSQAMRDVMRTKRSIVRVCRCWKVLGEEFLYESVSVRWKEKLVAVVRTMEESVPAEANRRELAYPESYVDSHSNSPVVLSLAPIATTGSRNAYGWWTKRIDVGFMRCPQVALLVERLLRHCPNLESFTDVGFPVKQCKAFPTDAVIVKALTPICPYESMSNPSSPSASASSFDSDIEYPPSLGDSSRTCSLTSIEWDSSVAPPVEEVLKLIQWSPRLHTLSLGTIIQTTAPQDDIQGAAILLPELQALKVTLSRLGTERFLAHAACWNLPALTHIELTSGSHIPGVLSPFFAAHGSKLRSLCVYHGPGGMSDIASLLPLCPNLTSLTFDLSAFTTLQNTMGATAIATGIREVRILGLTDRKVDVEELPQRWWDAMDENFGALLGPAFPEIRCVQAVDLSVECAAWWSTVLPKKRTQWWNEWVTQFKEKSVSFEDAEGHLLPLLLH